MYPITLHRRPLTSPTGQPLLTAPTDKYTYLLKPSLTRPHRQVCPRGQVAEKPLDAKRGDWLRVLLTEVPGASTKNKQGNLSTAMKIRKLTVDTRVLGAHLWFRVPELDETK
jgi:hypothetical protein